MNIVKAVQQDFLQLLQSVSGIVERRHTLPILANILLRKVDQQLQVFSSNLELQIKAQGEMGGESGGFTTTVGARKLFDILRSLPEDQIVSLNAQNNRLVLQAGKSKYTLQTLPSSDFPMIQESAQYGAMFSVPQKAFKNLLQQVSFAMAVQDIRYYLNGLLLVVEGNMLRMVATDGHRLVYGGETLEMDAQRQEVILPRKTVMELQRLLNDTEEKIEIQFARNQARFSFNNIELVTKLIEGKFPDYDRFMQMECKNRVILGRSPFLTVLQRCAILTNEKLRGVQLNIQKDQLCIVANNAEQEEAREEMDIDYSGDTVEIGLNVTYLTDMLSNGQHEMVQLHFNDASSSVFFTIPESADYRYIVMPMRI